MQIVGEICPICGERIAIAPDAVFCKECRKAFHRNCLKKEDICSICGRDIRTDLDEVDQLEKTERQRSYTPTWVVWSWLAPIIAGLGILLVALGSAMSGDAAHQRLDLTFRHDRGSEKIKAEIDYTKRARSKSDLDYVKQRKELERQLGSPDKRVAEKAQRELYRLEEERLTRRTEPRRRPSSLSGLALEDAKGHLDLLGEKAKRMSELEQEQRSFDERMAEEDRKIARFGRFSEVCVIAGLFITASACLSGLFASILVVREGLRCQKPWCILHGTAGMVLLVILAGLCVWSPLGTIIVSGLSSVGLGTR